MTSTESVPLRIPRISEAQRAELEELEAGLGSAALRCLGELAGPSPGAWRQVQRLRKKRELLSVRLGLHHRPLFSLSPVVLQLVAVIHRKNLERYLATATGA